MTPIRKQKPQNNPAAVSTASSSDHHLQKQIQSDEELRRKSLLRQDQKESYIKCLQNPHNLNELTSSIKWMVQKGTSSEIPVILTSRRNPMCSQEVLELIDHAIKEILKRDAREQQKTSYNELEKMVTPVAEEVVEIRDRRYQEMQEYAVEVLESAINAEQWLHSSRTELDDLTPYDLLATEQGAEIVREMLGRIDHGVYF